MLEELETAQSLLKFLHFQAKTALKGLDEAALNWQPEGVEGANSIFGLALHIATSQVAFSARASHQELKLDLPGLKPGETVFQQKGEPGQAEGLLRRAAEITNGVFESLTGGDLAAEATLPGGWKGTGRSWIHLMLLHGGEHVGHLSLTRQFYESKLKEANKKT